MAMVYCRGCGKEIHESAPTCPHCGFVQNTPTVIQLKNSQWMAVTAFILSLMCFLNWFNLPDWNKDMKVGLWMFSITSLTFAVITIQQNRNGKIFAWISIGIVIMTMLILIGQM